MRREKGTDKTGREGKGREEKGRDGKCGQCLWEERGTQNLR